MIGTICATGAYSPSRILENNDLAKIVETSDEWIRERTGVKRRHLIEGDTTTSMAIKAAKAALSNGQMLAAEIDMIIVSTISPDIILPSVACEVQKEIKAINATCFDLNAACTGFVFAYNTVQTYMESGLCKTALIIGSESLSTLVDWTDRGTCILFGDGAGAVILKATEGEFPPITTYSSGEKGGALTCENYTAQYRTGEERKKSTYMQMDGQEVFKFAVRQVPKSIWATLEKGNLNVEEIDYFVLHQANSRIIEAIAKQLKIDTKKFPMNLAEYGNTSSASIPLLLDEMNQKKMLTSGKKLLLSGYGAGLTWGTSFAVIN